MNKQGVTSNDILEALSIRINDTIRPNRNKEKKNNAYFWIFKCILLLIYIQILVWIFFELKEIGVFAIYKAAKSLRSILSIIWIMSLDFMKGLIILYLLYSHFKIFTESPYFKSLYQQEKKMQRKKKKIVKVIDKVFKAFAILYLVVIGLIAAISVFAFMYMLSMIADGMLMVSPILMMALIFTICLLVFKHVQNKFFDILPKVNKNYILILACALVASVCLFGYEISSFNRDGSLPKGFNITEKEQHFILQDGQNVTISSDTKLDNVNLVEDDSLINEIKVELSYYKTAKVWHVSEYNDYDDLKLTFISDVDLEKVDVRDILKLFVSTFNTRTIYNYNLFKYPTINVYANKSDFNRIKIK